MTHTTTAWSESGMNTTTKVNALNNLEKTYDDAISYMNAFPHTIYTKAQSDSRYYKTPNHPSGRSDTGAGCGINAAFLSGKTLADIQAGSLPHGAIGMFGIGAIPGVLQECDGSNGSPDMRDYFLRGASPNYPPRSIGGQNSYAASFFTTSFTSPGHILTIAELPAHTHTYSDLDNPRGNIGLGNPSYPWPGDWRSRTDNTISTNGYANGTSDPHYHSGCSFSWSGYLDENNNSISGALDNRPKYITVRFVMVK